MFSDTANVAGAEMTIVSGLKWDNDLLNKSSRLYKDQTVTVESLVIFPLFNFVSCSIYCSSMIPLYC